MGQQTYLYHLSSPTAVFVRIEIPGFQKTDDILVFSEKMTKTTQRIPLFSQVQTETCDSVNIYLYFQSENLKVQSIFIYAKGCIINATKEKLLFYSVKSLGNSFEMLNKMKWNKALLPGQERDKDKNKQTYQIILFDETTEIAIAHETARTELSNSVSIKGIGETQVAALKVLEIKENNLKNGMNKLMIEQFCEFAINISSKCSGFFFYFIFFFYV